MEKSWKVTFEKNGPEGEKLPIEKTFSWGAYTVYIPGVHLFAEGLILDICLEVNREKMAAFLEKWKDTFRREPTERERRQIEGENPLLYRYSQKLWVNGVELKRCNGQGSSHIPADMLPEDLRRDQVPAFVEGLGLAEDKVWAWMRMRYFWEGEKVTQIDVMEMELRQIPYDCLGERFAMPGIGECVTLHHPKNGAGYVLTVKDIRKETAKLPPQPDTVYPENVIVMSYQTEPQLSRKVFYLTDTEESDPPKRLSKTESTGGTFGMIMRNPDHYAVSSAHFEPIEMVTWQAVFLEKDLEDITVKLL